MGFNSGFKGLRSRCIGTVRAQTQCQSISHSINSIVDAVHVIGDVCHNLGYSDTECCCTKYGTNFHKQSFVRRTYAACLALEYLVPAGVSVFHLEFVW